MRNPSQAANVVIIRRVAIPLPGSVASRHMIALKRSSESGAEQICGSGMARLKASRLGMTLFAGELDHPYRLLRREFGCGSRVREVVRLYCLCWPRIC